MDSINTNLSSIRKDLQLITVAPTYRQDPKLVEAIDKLFYRNSPRSGISNGDIVLPDRKLNFDEVQNYLQQCSKGNSSQILIKDKENNKKDVIKKIEEILHKINETANNGDSPTLVIRNQRLWSNCIYDLDRVTLKSVEDAKKTTVVYSSQDKSRFNIIIFVLTKVHELLTKSLTVTRRELFYQNVTRFRNQGNLDVAVRDICCILERPPWSLCILATAKGLIAGPLTLHYANGTVVDCSTSGGVLIPQDVEGITEFRSSAKYILVVEKDAVFQKLLDEGALVRLGPVIIITGKGYPDVCTRQLLCRLCNELRLRALALVDFDPHGYEIFLTYKYGSLAQSHLASTLACNSLALLGVRHQDILTLAPTETKLKLTNLDKRKLAALLRRPYLETAVGLKIKLELKSMLDGGVKAEIEAMAPTAAALCDAYLPSKIIQNDFVGL